MDFLRNWFNRRVDGRCPQCRKTFRHSVGDGEWVEPCPKCQTPLFFCLYGAFRIPSSVSLGEIAHLTDQELTSRISELTRQRFVLPPALAGLPTPKEVCAVPGLVVKYGMFDLEEPPAVVADRLAGSPFAPLRLSEWEGRDCKYRTEFGVDGAGRPHWAYSAYEDHTFYRFEYAGNRLVRVTGHERSKPFLRSDLTGNEIRTLDLRYSEEPFVTTLNYQNDRIHEAVSRIGRQLLQTRRYVHEPDGLSKIVIEEYCTVSRAAGLEWMGGIFRKEEKETTVDVAKRRKILALPWSEPRKIGANIEGAVVGRFGKSTLASAPRCPGGEHPMRALLEVGDITVWWCTRCSFCDDCRPALYVDLSNPREPRVLSPACDADSYDGPHSEIDLPAVACAPPPVEHQTIHKLGGDPLWIQSPSWPECLGCGNLPEFWGQVAADSALGYEFGDSGVVYVFWCGKCRITASLEQCF